MKSCTGDGYFHRALDGELTHEYIKRIIYNKVHLSESWATAASIDSPSIHLRYTHLQEYLTRRIEWDKVEYNGMDWETVYVLLKIETLDTWASDENIYVNIDRIGVFIGTWEPNVSIANN